MSTRHITIGLVAGEMSGDILGAGLVRALRNHLSKVRFVGVTGPRMQAENMETWYSIEEIAVMGIVEILEKLPRLVSIRRDLVRRFIKLCPDIFIGIDAPDFTIALEHRLKQRGIRTVHYVSPSVWAWRHNRISKIGKATDNILVFLPFEKAFYDRYNIPCQFIGHTLADSIPINPDKAGARQTLNIAADSLCLVLLPGSRKSEVTMLSADFLLAAKILYTNFPKLEIIVPLVNAARRIEFENIQLKVAPNLPLRILNNQSQQAMIAADAALLASGTASLECMLAKCPMVVAYRMQYLTFALARWLVKTPWISLPNLLAGNELVKEFLQEACRPEILAKEIEPLLDTNNHHRLAMLAKFSQLHMQIKCNANEQAARAVLALLNH